MTDSFDVHDRAAVVLDLGSFCTRFGMAQHDDVAMLSFPSCLGRPRFSGGVHFDGMGGMPVSHWVGEAALNKRSLLTTKWPIEAAMVTNWDDVGKLWSACFKQLSVAPDEHPILMTEPFYNPKANRERTITISFEEFQLQSFFLHEQCSLALLSTGRTHGLVVDVGEDCTRVVPVSDGFPIARHATYVDVGARTLWALLPNVLSGTGCADQRTLLETRSGQQPAIFAVREKLLRVAQDASDVTYDADAIAAAAAASSTAAADSGKAESKAGPDKGDAKAAASTDSDAATVFELPDGQRLRLTRRQQHLCAEALFRPQILQDFKVDSTRLPIPLGGAASRGVADAVCEVVRRCDWRLSRALLGNVVLSGAATRMPGFAERLLKDVRARLRASSLAGSDAAAPGSLGPLSEVAIAPGLCARADDGQNAEPTGAAIPVAGSRSQSAAADSKSSSSTHDAEAAEVAAAAASAAAQAQLRRRQHAVWLGGALLSELSTFRHMCISRAEYEEEGLGGTRIIHRMCPL